MFFLFFFVLAFNLRLWRGPPLKVDLGPRNETAPICLHVDAPTAPIDAAVVTSNSNAAPSRVCADCTKPCKCQPNTTYLWTKQSFQDSQARLQPHRRLVDAMYCILTSVFPHRAFPLTAPFREWDPNPLPAERPPTLTQVSQLRTANYASIPPSSWSSLYSTMW